MFPVAAAAGNVSQTAQYPVGGGGTAPWEGPLAIIEQSLTGPVAGSLALIGIVVAGGTLVFGGQLGDFARRAIMLVLAVSMIVLAGSLLDRLFPGAVSATI